MVVLVLVKVVLERVDVFLLAAEQLFVLVQTLLVLKLHFFHFLLKVINLFVQLGVVVRLLFVLEGVRVPLYSALRSVPLHRHRSLCRCCSSPRNVVLSVLENTGLRHVVGDVLFLHVLLVQVVRLNTSGLLCIRHRWVQVLLPEMLGSHLLLSSEGLVAPLVSSLGRGGGNARVTHNAGGGVLQLQLQLSVFLHDPLDDLLLLLQRLVLHLLRCVFPLCAV